MKDALRKAEMALNREMDKQIEIMYSTAAVILWRKGWRKLRIMRRFAQTQLIWDECAEWGVDKSMLQMLEDETGIELTLHDYDRSYHEFAYLDGRAWNGKLLNKAQVTYMHQQQLKWMPLLILACILISLHRDEHWGAERIERFVWQVDEIRKKLGVDPKEYTKLMESETDMRRTDIWAEKANRKGA